MPRQKKSLQLLTEKPTDSKRIKETRAKIKEDAEIKRLEYEAEIDAIKARFKHEIEKQLAMHEIFEEFCEKTFKGKKPKDMSDVEKQTYERILKIYDRLSDPDND